MKICHDQLVTKTFLTIPQLVPFCFIYIPYIFILEICLIFFSPGFQNITSPASIDFYTQKLKIFHFYEMHTGFSQCKESQFGWYRKYFYFTEHSDFLSIRYSQLRQRKCFRSKYHQLMVPSNLSVCQIFWQTLHGYSVWSKAGSC